MAPISKSVALAGALFSVLSTAVPLNKRAVVWETVTDVVWTTVDTTVTITPGQTSFSIPTPTGGPGHFVELTAASEASSTPVASSSSSAVAVQTAAAVQAPQPSQESSSAAAAPVPTSSIVTPAPAPTSSASATSSAPAPSSSSSSGGSGYSGQCSESSPCSGDGTYYDTATTASNPSSCGTTDDGLTENVLALPVGMMSEKYCGKTVTVNYNGKTAQGKVVDKCMGCQGDSIDLSRHFFSDLADLSEGRLSDVKWYIN